MATAPASPNDLTRQQLDELDALLQRMLSLPLAANETAAAETGAGRTFAPVPLPDMPPAPRLASPPAYNPPPPTVFSAANLRDLAPPGTGLRDITPLATRRGDALTPPSVQMLMMPAPSEPTPAPIPRRDSARAARNPEPVLASPLPFQPSAIPTPSPDPLPIAAANAPAVDRSAPIARIEPIPASLKPFVFLNSAVDQVLGLMGAPGRLFRSAFGKNLLGIAGISLLAYTGAKIAQLEGWLSIPFGLPWPD